jgi:hypothetical protein
MRNVLRRVGVPLLVVSSILLVINSMPGSIPGSGSDSGLISKAVMFLDLFLATSFIGGAVHTGLLRRRSDAGLTVCFLDGAMIGMLSNLIVQVLHIAMHGLSLDLVMPPSRNVDAVWWIGKLVLSFVIVMIFGFMGLLSGGLGGSIGYLVSIWMARAPTIGRKNS